MRFLIDEDVDVRVIGLLKKLGHEAKRVPSGIGNGSVIQLANNEKRCLITRDADFTDAQRYPPSKTPGIIHLDIHPPRFERLAPAIRSFIKSAEPGEIEGKLVVLREEDFGEFE